MVLAADVVKVRLGVEHRPLCGNVDDRRFARAVELGLHAGRFGRRRVGGPGRTRQTFDIWFWPRQPERHLGPFGGDGGDRLRELLAGDLDVAPGVGPLPAPGQLTIDLVDGDGGRPFGQIPRRLDEGDRHRSAGYRIPVPDPGTANVTNDTLSFLARQAYRSGVNLERKSSSTLSRMDDGLLVVVAIIGVVIALSIFGFVVHLFALLFKVAILAAVAGLVFKAVSRRR